jgi:ubiquinone/menaquinone biosynthesis C-methylase UbiE
MPEPDVRDLNRREFTRQAANFERSGSIFRHEGILGWIAEHVPVAPGARILDVAGGTGQTGRHLARQAEGTTATIVDLTEPMLAAGLRSVLEEGRSDVTFVLGDACQLPFPADQFDVVVSRFAMHHMDDPAQAIAEMARVCRPEGSVTVIDMVSGGERHDHLERLRDPSHTGALPEDELREHLAAAGRAPARESEMEFAMPAGPWVEQAKPPDDAGERVLGELEAEAAGGPATGLRAARGEDGTLTITQRWLLLGG